MRVDGKTRAGGLGVKNTLPVVMMMNLGKKAQFCLD